MYLFKKPTDERIGNFIESQSRLEFTYPSDGATRNGDHPSGFLVDHNRIRLGSGQATFDSAKRALCVWRHYRFDWIELYRPDVDPVPDQTVGVLVRALALWVLNACRIAYVIEEEQYPLHKFAFAYGTLPEHAESGEERFKLSGTKRMIPSGMTSLRFPGPTSCLHNWPIRMCVESRNSLRETRCRQ